MSPRKVLTEDVWKTIFDSVYDGPQFKSQSILINKIYNVINHINCFKREERYKLFSGFGTNKYMFKIKIYGK